MVCFCFLCTSRLLKLGDFAEYLSKIPYLLPVLMSLPINHLPYPNLKLHNRGHGTAVKKSIDIAHEPGKPTSFCQREQRARRVVH